MATFNINDARKIQQQTVDDNAPADVQGVAIKSPSKMFWFRAHGESFEDIIQIHTARLFDSNGDEEDYLIYTDDAGLREQIANKLGDDLTIKALVRCVNWFGTEFLWMPTSVAKGGSRIGSQTSRKAIETAQKQWIKCKWRGNNLGWVVTKHPGDITDKKIEWSNMTFDEVINQVFHGRIITDLNHEALVRNSGGKI